MLQVRSALFETAARPAPLALRLLRPAELGPDEAAAWDALGTEAEAPSIFAEPWFMRRSLAHCDPAAEARLAVVQDPSGAWLGALPVAPALRQGRSPVPAWTAWRHANQFVGSPLVRRGEGLRFWRGLLDGLGARPGRVSLVLPALPTDDPLTQALRDLCAADGRALVVDRRIERACLRVGDTAGADARQRSRVRGLERKLEAEVGPVTFDVVRVGAPVEALLESFLALERSGWKGRAGSALACAEATRAFFGDVCRAAAGRGGLEVATLSAGGRLLAISTQLAGADWIYGFKSAYDESFARYAPGLLLLDRLTRTYRERGGPAVDSCAAPDQQPVSRLWPGRRELVDCRVALGGALRGRLFGAMLACERIARGARTHA